MEGSDEERILSYNKTPSAFKAVLGGKSRPTVAPVQF
jgi:hypothetical protein